MSGYHSTTLFQHGNTDTPSYLPRNNPLRRVTLLLLFLLSSASPLISQAERGILVREAVLYLSPDTGVQKLGSVGRGREVVIIEKSRGWLHVFADVGERRNISGWILDKGVVRNSTADGDRILFGEAADSEWEASRRGGRRSADRDAFRLYFQIAEFFPNSPLAAEALYRAADIQWQLDAEDVRTRPSAKQRDPALRAKIDEELMRRVMKKFPGTKWADLAAFHLIDNKLCGDWEGQPKCPERESEMYGEYARKRPQSPKAPEALYNAAWRQAALIQIYKGQNNPEHAERAKQKATSLAQRIVAQYAQSDWSARGRRLTFLVEQNVAIYGNVVE